MDACLLGGFYITTSCQKHRKKRIPKVPRQPRMRLLKKGPSIAFPCYIRPNSDFPSLLDNRETHVFNSMTRRVSASFCFSFVFLWQRGVWSGDSPNARRLIRMEVMFQGVFLAPLDHRDAVFRTLLRLMGEFTSEDKDRSSATGRGIKNGGRLRLGKRVSPQRPNDLYSVLIRVRSPILANSASWNRREWGSLRHSL